MEFTISERPNNIFYGDICKINGQGCLIFGFGKSKAAQIASSDNMIAYDMACLTKDDEGTLYGHFETEIRAKGISDPIKERIEIKHFLRMLDQEETNKLLWINPHLKELDRLIEIPYENFIEISQFNITFTAPADFPFRPEGLPEIERDPQKRIEHFIKLSKDSNVRTFVVPWRETVEEKAVMIKEAFGLQP
ncbi:hypothetical protein P8818_16545 [Bacillus velezensis]|uniref:hypothetical protein n=1 Tax=Bacillus TaxID=1386 RepID=UPI000366BED2|nr:MULTISPECIES: hypothetical protein [Bacillus]AYC54127.1 hypothetical protein C7M53_23055 [Bacillus licheniformis]MCT6515559.1 hypothetical protein [Bacillus subtilis]MCY7780152.1 hypothetical protein [Bacillus haynesii]MEC0383775.1 hypothetical protein [Bacillus velezensis]MEC0389162.1 hypothetical protein [Bacillus velezensis]